VTQFSLWRRVLAELLGSALLAAAVIGSGIAAQRLSPGDTGLELLENAAAHLLSEVVATLGLVLVIFARARSGRATTASAGAGASSGRVTALIASLRRGTRCCPW
jgi:glycerol uptake facilitator-like aquaporin